MAEENKQTTETETLWFIDFDWHQKNNRSVAILIRQCLCPEHSEQSKQGKIEVKKLVTDIKNCCSKMPEFITEKMPVLESVFRLFLAYGNKPLNLEELAKRLSEQRGGDTYRTSVEILPRLLESDQYYGLNKVNI